jgi:hypothetical protein
LAMEDTRLSLTRPASRSNPKPARLRMQGPLSALLRRWRLRLRRSAIHPQRQFAPATLNAGFRADNGRSNHDNWVALVDPFPTLAQSQRSPATSGRASASIEAARSRKTDRYYGERSMMAPLRSICSGRRGEFKLPGEVVRSSFIVAQRRAQAVRLLLLRVPSTYLRP